MIRNNQNGRRRGRGGGGVRPPQASGGNFGNRIDNRQRGNASQLLEKYKTLARDATQAGDRVIAEYYMQHAEHYFRVLNDYRSSQPDQQQRPQRSNYSDAYEDEDSEEAGFAAGGFNGEAADDEPSAEQRGNGYAGDRQRPREWQGREAPRAEARDGARDGARDYQGQGGREAPRDGARDFQDNRDQGQANRDGARTDRDGRGGQRPPAGEPREPYRGEREGYRAERDGQRREEPREGGREVPREAREPRGENGRARMRPRFDDEAVSGIAGLPGPATVIADEPPIVEAASSAEPAGEIEAPKRRRGRPRKVDQPVGDSGETLNLADG